MSRETPLSLVFAERIFGIILIIIGLILAYNTFTSLNVAGLSAGFSIISGISLIIIGFILLT
ncbi:MAG: hypothetical protein QXH91_05690, partial [Candidatus Bathyarchaeia archaeon]